MKFIYLAVLFPLVACDGGHLGNPLLLPVNAVTSGVSNANYNKHRAAVKSYLAANRSDLLRGYAPGPAWAGLKQVARTRADREAQMLSDFIRIRDLPFDRWLEQATVIAMVMGDF